MYYLFIRKPKDIVAYKANFDRVKKSINEGKTPVYSEIRSARTNFSRVFPII